MCAYEPAHLMLVDLDSFACASLLQVIQDLGGSLQVRDTADNKKGRGVFTTEVNEIPAIQQRLISQFHFTRASVGFCDYLEGAH